MYLALLLYIIPTFYIFIRTKRNLHIFQQNFYNENNRYLKWGLKKVGEVFKNDSLLLVLNFVNIFLKNKLLTIFNVLYLFLYIFEKNKISRESVKIPLNLTNRIKRLTVTISVIYFIPLIYFLVKKNLYIFLLIYSLLISYNFLIIYLINIINKPIEKYVFWYYKKKAIKKIKSYRAEVIGITGSYGKTSSKNILNDIISVKYNTLPTPKNYNTQYGLIITINNYLNKFHDFFIAEMGAFKMGRIRLLCKLVKPKYGIITKIGEAHLETFKSKENIQKGKFELIESLPQDGLAILNKDDEMQVNYKLQNTVPIKWIGIDNQTADVIASNIKMTKDGMNFDVTFKESGEKAHFETKLLGKPNVYNILAALALGKHQNMTLKELTLGVKKIKPIEHRLELKEFAKNITIIDDAYNSNPVGSQMALDVLDLMPGRKIIITPGMIELGPKQYELNKEFGKHISKVADIVILIGEKQTKPILDGLNEVGYNKKNLIIINDIFEAFNIIKEKSKDEHTYVLLENDLPDIFNE